MSDLGEWGFVIRRVSDNRAVERCGRDTLYWKARGSTLAGARADVLKRARKRAGEDVYVSGWIAENSRAAELDAAREGGSDD